MTGASRGIGLAIAHRLAEAGATVGLCARHKEGLKDAEASIREKGGEATAFVCDLSNVDQLDGLAAGVLREFGSLDVLCNNAAASTHFGALMEMPIERWVKTFQINLLAPLYLSQKFGNSFRSGASIINVASIGAYRPNKYTGLYNMSKAALIMLTKSLALELGSKGIRVNAIAPGLIGTEFSRPLWEDEQRVHEIAGLISLDRLGTPEEVAAAVLFLASDDSSYISGATLVVDGGVI